MIVKRMKNPGFFRDKESTNDNIEDCHIAIKHSETEHKKSVPNDNTGFPIKNCDKIIMPLC